MAGSDSELYKDKIEVSLDGRQIFYLFFGGAVVACLVFVLGVMVGRRLEARGHVDRVAATSSARDPLAALDKLDGAGRMTYPSALSAGGTNATAEVDREIAAMAARRGNAPKVAPAKEPEAKPAPAVDPKAAKAAEAKAAADTKAAEAKAARDAEAKAKADAKAAAEAKAAAAKAKFTLQLSAFQDRSEADSFLATVKNAGYPAYVTSADVDGKTFFRVRLGNYATYDEAVAAKAEFERKVPKIAYVTRL